MTLLEIERKMAEAVMRPLTTRYGMRKRTAGGASVADEAASFVKPNSKLSSFERLEIYNRQYWFRILSAFSEDFPGLAATVGRKRFDALMRAYLEQNPSRSFTLRNLGSNLEAWLRDHPEWTGNRHAVALEVVRLEWAYIEAFDNGEEPALSLADAAALGVDSLLALQPHVRLLQLEFAVDDFVIAVRRRQVSSSIASNASTEAKSSGQRIHLNTITPSKLGLAVHRFDNSVYYKRLEPEAYRLLIGLESGISLGAALENAFQESEIPPAEQAAHIQQWFSTWSELGWFCRPRKTRMRQ
jgi:Putative DNA-binding domain